jgi:hypothetical protein
MNLQDINPHFITDTSGNKVSVVLSMDEYKTIMEELEELEDIINYDKAKTEDDGERILLSDYLKTRKKVNAQI